MGIYENLGDLEAWQAILIGLMPTCPKLKAVNGFNSVAFTYP